MLRPYIIPQEKIPKHGYRIGLLLLNYKASINLTQDSINIELLTGKYMYFPNIEPMPVDVRRFVQIWRHIVS